MSKTQECWVFDYLSFMTLEDIIISAARGKASAQKALFLKTSNHLKTVALRYVYYSEAADDVLQESYIRIFAALSRFDYINDKATMGWMRQITAREAIRYLKSKQRYTLMEDQEVLGQRGYDEFPMAIDDMHKMLLKLPAKQRIVFNLVAIEGYNHKVVADLLNMKESSSRSLLVRARQKLQEELSKHQTYERA